jgi:hypothetical protein
VRFIFFLLLIRCESVFSATCYEVLNPLPGSQGLTVYPVNVSPELCMSAVAVNPWGLTVAGHLVAFDGDYSIPFFSGVDLADVVICSWLIILTWAAAWSVKNMKKGIGR